MVYKLGNIINWQQVSKNRETAQQHCGRTMTSIFGKVEGIVLVNPLKGF